MTTISDDVSFESIWTTLQPRAFGELPGRLAVVEALKNRLQYKANITPIILHGPRGVGKSLLAKLYAKAILCDKPDPDGSSCNRCDQCRSFDAGQYGWGYVENKTFDFIVKDTPETLNEYHKRLRSWVSRLQKFLNDPPSWVSRRVVVLGQVDKYPVEAFDILLKAIEKLTESSNGMFKRTTRTTVVFLADDISRVRRAGRSRCLDYRLRQLSDADSRNVFRSLIRYTGVPSDERTLDMLVQAASGLPGRIKRIFYIVASTGGITVESVTETLKLDWVGDTADYLSGLFEYRNLTSDVLRPRDTVDLGKQVRRIKSFLYQIRPQSEHLSSGLGAHHDVAFMHQQHDLVKALSDKLITCSKTQGKSPVSLWQELIELWVNSEITDEMSFSEVGRRTEYLLRGGDEVDSGRVL